MKNLVSIIIPVHNSIKAENCIRAIENQTYQNVEIIKVELEGFPAEKRNYGFKLSKGEYVYFLDEDEYLSAGAIEECVKKIEEGYDVVAVPVVKKPTKSYVANCIAIVRESTFKTMFFKREVLEKIGLLDPRFILCDDLEILQRALRSGYKVGAIANGYIVHDEDVGFNNVIQKTILSRRPFRLLKSTYGADSFSLIVRANFHRKRILKEVSRQPKYLPGVLFLMSTRFILRRIP